MDKLENELRALRKINEQLRRQLAQPASTKEDATVPLISSSASKASLSANGPENETLRVGEATLADSSIPSGPSAAAGQLRKMMSMPGMQAMIEQQQAAQIEAGYGKLMDILQLNDEEKAHFKKLLLERTKSQTEAGLKMMDGDLTEEAKTKLVKEMQAQRQVYDDSIKTFLNDAGDYETYQQWEDSRPERMMFDLAGRHLFAESDEPLSAQQEQQLLDIMVEARKSPPAAGMSDRVEMNTTQMTPEKVDLYMRDLESHHQRVKTEATKVLTPKQLITLERYLEQSRSMSKTGLEMSNFLLKGKSGSE